MSAHALIACLAAALLLSCACGAPDLRSMELVKARLEGKGLGALYPAFEEQAFTMLDLAGLGEEDMGELCAELGVKSVFKKGKLKALWKEARGLVQMSEERATAMARAAGEAAAAASRAPPQGAPPAARPTPVPKPTPIPQPDDGEPLDAEPAQPTPGKAVLDLTPSNLAATSAAHSVLLVEFYAPWCPHCQKLEPEWERAARMLHSRIKGEQGRAALARLNCDEHKGFCQRAGVTGYPSVKVYFKDNRQPVALPVPKEAEKVSLYAMRMSLPAFDVVNSWAEVEAVRQHDPMIVLGLYDMGSLESVVTFQRMGFELAGLHRFVLFNPRAEPAELRGVAQRLQVELPAIVVLKDDEPHAPYLVYDEALTDSAALKRFVEDRAFPLVCRVGKQTLRQMRSRGLPLLWLMLEEKDFGSPMVEAGRALAAEFRDRLTVVLIDGVEHRAQGVQFGLQTLPFFVILTPDLDRSFRYKGEVDPAAFSTWVHKYMDRRLSPTKRHKAQPSPALPRKQPQTKFVVELTTESFKKYRKDRSLVLVVFFYKPKSQLCDEFKPTWNELARRLQGRPQLVVAQLDTSKHSTGLPIMAFPTIARFPAQAKKPVYFKGKRSLRLLSEFADPALARDRKEALTRAAEAAAKKAAAAGAAKKGGAAPSAAKDEL